MHPSRRILWLAVGAVLFVCARSIAAHEIDTSTKHVRGASVAGLLNDRARLENEPDHVRRAVQTASNVRLAVQNDAIFANGFEDEAAGQPPPVCNPPPAGYTQRGPFTLSALWAPQPVGSTLVQIKMGGDQYSAFAFIASDLPAVLNEFQADTSNVGQGAVGADFRMVVVSECAGDFTPVAAQAACDVFANEGAYLYLNFGAPLAFACNLDPSKTYHFNVTFGPSECNVALSRNVCAYRTAVLPR